MEQNLLGSNAAGRQIKLRTRKRVECRFQILAETYNLFSGQQLKAGFQCRSNAELMN